MLKRFAAVLFVLFSAAAWADCPTGAGAPASVIFGYTIDFCGTYRFKTLEAAEDWVHQDTTYPLSNEVELAFTGPVGLDAHQQNNSSWLDYRPFGSLASTYYRPPAEYLPSLYAAYVVNWPPTTVNANCTAQQQQCSQAQSNGFCGSVSDELSRVQCQIQNTWNDSADHYCWSVAGAPQTSGQFPASPTSIRSASYTDPSGQNRASGELLFKPQSSTSYDGLNINFTLQRCTNGDKRSLEYGMEQKMPFFCDRGLQVNPQATTVDQACYGSTINPPGPKSVEALKRVVSPPTVQQTPQPCEGDPCLPGNGNSTTIESGFAYGNIKFDLYYASMRQTVRYSGFDRNWSHTFAKRIITTALTDGEVTPGNNGLIYVQDAQADLEAYRLATNSTDTYRSTSAVGKVLKVEARYGGEWDIYDLDGTVDVYDDTGRLIEIVHPDDPRKTLAITYVDQDPADYRLTTYGRTATVTDGSGRSISFQYSPSPQYYPTSIVADDGTELMSFGYDATDDSRRLTSITQFGQTRHYNYNENGHVGADLPYSLTGIYDEDDRRYSTFEFDDWGRVSASWHGVDAEKVALAYIDDTEVDVTLPLGAVRIFDYRNLNAYRKPDYVNDDDGQVHYQYDSAFRVTSKTDKRNVLTNYEYSDPSGLNLHETARTEAVGTPEQRRIETDWDAGSNRVSESRIYHTDSSNNFVMESKTHYTYNASGQLVTTVVTDPVTLATRTWANSYCTQTDVSDPNSGCALVGLLKSTDGPRTDVSDVTTYAYYRSTASNGSYHIGDLHTRTSALGLVWTTVSYNDRGQPLRQTDPNGTVVDLTYTSRGWLQTRTVRATADGSASSGDSTTVFSYDNAGDLESMQRPDSTISYAYDSARRLIRITDSLGDYIDYCPGGEGSVQCLDAQGHRLVEEVNDSGGTLRHGLGRVYDDLGHLLQQLNAGGRPTQDFSNVANPPPYDNNDNPVHWKDGLGVETVRQYDSLNRLTAAIRDYAGTSSNTSQATSSYSYDARGNRLSITDPDNLSTSYTYDGLNDLRAIGSPDTGNASYTYDSGGNKKTAVDARGIQTNYAYDALNRLTTITYPTNTKAPAGTTPPNQTFYYDQPDSVTGCAGSFYIGRVTRMVDPSGTTTYCYDRRGNILRKTQQAGLSTRATSATYTVGDKISTRVYPSGAVVEYQRDSEGRVNHVTWRPSATGPATVIVSNITYYPFGPTNVITYGNGRTLTKSYDEDYFIDAISSSAVDGLSLNFNVDRMGNISSISSPTALKKYFYDSLYRLTSVYDTTAVETYTYNKTGDRLTKVLAGQPSQTYGYYPGSHRLRGIGNGVTLPPSRTYDANGNLLNDQLGDVFAYDERNRPVSVTSSPNSYTFEYAADGTRVLQTATSPNFGTSSKRFLYEENGLRLSETSYNDHSVQLSEIEYVYVGDFPIAVASYGAAGSNGTLTYLETDQVGSPRVGADPSTNTSLWTWDIFGSAFGDNLPTGTSYVAARYPGQYEDTSLPFNYNFMRDYEPGTGRYAQSDPIGLEGSRYATYAYANDVPLAYIDLFGLKPGMAGGALNDKLQDIPDNMCDIWPANCYKRLLVCMRAECMRKDHCGHIWIEVITDWMPERPSILELKEEDPACVCTEWQLRKGD